MKRIISSNDIELFQEFANGNEEAFRKIFDRYFPLLVNFIFKITHTQHSAEEITQEVFLRFWIKRNAFAEVTELKSWLYKVASNLAFDHLRKEAHYHKLVKHYRQQPIETEETELWLDLKESKAVIDAAVRQLPEQQQRIFKLSREGGLSHLEIAERLNLSPNTVKNHLVKALQTLRKRFNRAAHFFFSNFF